MLQEVQAPRFKYNPCLKLVKLSVLGTGRLYTQDIFLALISIKGLVDRKPLLQPEGLCQWKISMNPSEIEPATFRLVAQYYTSTDCAFACLLGSVLFNRIITLFCTKFMKLFHILQENSFIYYRKTLSYTTGKLLHILQENSFVYYRKTLSYTTGKLFHILQENSFVYYRKTLSYTTEKSFIYYRKTLSYTTGKLFHILQENSSIYYRKIFHILQELSYTTGKLIYYRKL